MEQAIIDFFAGYAYEPVFVYLFIALFMMGSSMGLPLPEEVTLVGAGIVAHMASHPDLYPPPYPGAEGVSLIPLAIFCFVAAVGSDYIIFLTGKLYGKKILKTKLGQRLLSPERFDKINHFFNKYSYWASGIFRFTPGIRFPGFLSCGMMGIPTWKFLLMDGGAALLTVPTQVVLVAIYGEVIMAKFTEFKIYILSFFGFIILIWLVRKLIAYFKSKRIA